MERFSDRFTAAITLLGVDLLFLVPLVVLLGVIYVWKKPAFAVLKRNFVAYFTNPTGYVFLCLFVALTSYFAFWPPEFFNANLANLDQLNRVLPTIMLVFIPAITMSIWAEERRQGTDELLLTIPADDFDIVLGKYLAAAAIFTVSLLFSQISNFLVLINLGNPDMGLFLGNYFGYWMVGLAMLAVGMVASFLTANLTVGFVLGVVFCVPLVIVAWAEVVFPEAIGRALSKFSIPYKFQDFETGVISFASAVYFIMIIVTMLYLCMVLIGRRHWSGGKDGRAMGGHYVMRVIALLVIAGSISVFATHKYLFRKDVTSEGLSSLSESSVTLIKKVADASDQYLITIEAFISRDLPEQFVQKRFDLLATLREIDAIGGDKVSLKIYDGIDLYSEQANRAEMLYGIEREAVETTVRGARTTQNVIFGVAFKSGQERAVIPFMGESLPIEYELMRSLATVTQQERMTIGVLQTDAALMQAGTFARPGASERPLIEELRKQYDIVVVTADSPITEKFDVLLAVQPSSLTEPQMQNFLDVVRSGTPTAIFEDPFPLLFPAPGTSQPKRAGGNMFMPQQPQPKGDISKLWDLLDVDLVSTRALGGFGRPGGKQALVVWQDYNPHPEDAEVQNEFVWITPNCRAAEAYGSASPISSSL
ncbi:MAG: Gldg family protein, partial [Planctomycetota bacterium]|nr:Gldg family protein [Planctomycetota bacterium]